MRVAVQFGLEQVELEVGDDCLVEPYGGTPSTGLDDVPAAVARALETPLAFPALQKAIVPGDHVAIVLDGGIPRPCDVLGPLIECLAEAGVPRHDILIVEASSDDNSQNGLMPDRVPHGIRLAQHDPHDRNRLSYLASTKSGTRVYLNRDVVDADLVVLVGRVGYHPLLRYRGTCSSLFPGLADEAAQHQFRCRISKPITSKSQIAARRESDEVAWLLGVQFAIQIVIGRGNRIVQVLAGHCPDVQREAQRLLDRNWRQAVPRRAELVIASISGPPDIQGFAELGAALESAQGLVREGGRIVVLSAIDALPGTALKSANMLRDPAKTLEHLRSHPSADAISTWQIVRASHNSRVYLLSKLADELVEDLSIIPIGSVAEVQRLIDQVQSCLILNDAQLARVTVEEEDVESAS